MGWDPTGRGAGRAAGRAGSRAGGRATAGRVLAGALVALAVALAPGLAVASAPGPDLLVEAGAGGELAVGGAAQRSVTVRNVGTETARDVHVVVELPTGVRFANGLPVLGGGTCSVVSVGSPGGQALFGDCRRSALVAGASATLQMPIVATADAACGALTTRTQVSAVNEPLANADAGNRGTIADRLACGTTPGPDLAISVGAVPSRPLPGRTLVTYRIELTNRGDATAHDASASISFPGGMVVRGAPRPTPDARCTMSSSWVPPGPVHMAAACSFDELDPGDVAVVLVSARVPADPRCGDATAVVKAEADDEPRELRGDENRAVATSTFACRPRIQVSAHAPSAAHAGAAVPVTVRVRNVSGASIVDVRPRIAGCGDEVRRLAAGDGDRVLDPRERWTFGCRRSVPAGADPVVVPIAVTARDGSRQMATGHALRRIDVWHPAIAIDVSSPATVVRPGASAVVRATVRNVGDAPLTEVAISIPSLGVVATVDPLPPGAQRAVELDVTLPRRPGSVGTATATASDRLGRDVTAVEDVPLAVGAFTDGADPPDGDDDAVTGGSAFTGGDAASPAALALLLTATGIVAVLTGRRRVRR